MIRAAQSGLLASGFGLQASGLLARASLAVSTALLGAALACGCAPEVRAGGEGSAGRGSASSASGSPSSSAASLERLVARLREYVYATYDVESARDEAALASLRAAREALAEAMRSAGLPVGEGGLPGVVAELRDAFQARGDVVFVPLGEGAAGILLVRVAERRDVRDRELAGLRATYKAVVFDEAAIEDLETYRGRAASLPPARPVARAVGRTIYVDRSVARRLARELVIPRAAHAAELARRAASGAPLGPAEEKDLLRHLALEAAIREGGETVARAIAHEEELRLAALLATAPPDPRKLEDPGTAAKVERRATLAAIASGEPRYHLASALAATLAAPGTPPAEGAARALAVFSDGRPLHSIPIAELRAKAQAAAP